jgi:ribonucleoside-diphosphate reductase alpha chain
MTETVSDPVAAASAPHRGLRIGRVFSSPGTHPYEQVTWERRDVVMTNWRDGTVNFEQRGVEFPDFWSVNAANIVTRVMPRRQSLSREGCRARVDPSAGGSVSYKVLS